MKSFLVDQCSWMDLVFFQERMHVISVPRKGEYVYVQDIVIYNLLLDLLKLENAAL